MKKYKSFYILGMFVLLMVLTACGSAMPDSELTPTAVLPTLEPTATLTPTETSTPTRTPRPTATPNLVATQEYNEIASQVQEYYDEGYLSSVDGKYIEMDDFKEDWAQMDWYRWWWLDDSLELSSFVIEGHFSWSSAIKYPETSGCGFVFDIDIEGGSAYAVILDSSKILVLDHKGYWVGTTRGTGRVGFTLPAEADFSLVVNSEAKRFYVFVDETFVGEYSIPQNEDIDGTIGYTVLSGTNKDYGTRCTITDTKLWIVE